MKNLNFLLKKSYDGYGLLMDEDFKKILGSMIAYQQYLRPNVSEVLRSDFIVKWIEPVNEYQKKPGNNLDCLDFINRL